MMAELMRMMTHLVKSFRNLHAVVAAGDRRGHIGAARKLMPMRAYAGNILSSCLSENKQRQVIYNDKVIAPIIFCTLLAALRSIDA